MENSRNLLLLALAACVITICFGADDSNKWNYKRDDDKYGPDQWKVNFAECAEDRNSPIDLFTDKMKLYGQEAAKWELTGWDSNSKWTVLDNDYTVKYSLEGANSMKTAGGDLGSTYNVVQFHLHWGADDTKGSEHTLGGDMFPMEIHFVHANGEFADLTAAVESKNDDALAAVGFFFKLQDNDNPDLVDMINGVNQIREPNATSVEGFTMNVYDWTATPMKGNYYRYFGGLTTPGCNQIVQWTVFEEPVGISAAQMAIIRDQQSYPYGVDYYRPVVPLGTRKLKKFDTKYDPTVYGAASSLTAMWSLALVALLAKFI